MVYDTYIPYLKAIKWFGFRKIENKMLEFRLFESHEKKLEIGHVNINQWIVMMNDRLIFGNHMTEKKKKLWIDQVYGICRNVGTKLKFHSAKPVDIYLS